MTSMNPNGLAVAQILSTNHLDLRSTYEGLASSFSRREKCVLVNMLSRTSDGKITANPSPKNMACDLDSENATQSCSPLGAENGCVAYMRKIFHQLHLVTLHSQQ